MLTIISSALSKIVQQDTVAIDPSRCEQKVKENFSEINPGEEKAFNDIKVKAVEAYNIPLINAKKFLHPKGERVGYILSIKGHKIYHA